MHVATTADRSNQQGEVHKGVHVHRFGITGNALSGMKGDVDTYVRFVLSGSWDVVAMHCAQVWPTDALLPHLKKIKADKVLVSHGFSELHNPHYRSYFTSLAKSLKQANQIVALSGLLEEVSFCAQHGLPAPQIIPNGVDVAEWSVPIRGLREKWGIGKCPWLLSVSNHSSVKGHPTFFKIVGRVREKLSDVVGTVIGGHYPAARWGLGRFGIKGGCWYRCRVVAGPKSGVFLRWNVPRQDVVSAVQEADLVIIASRREASPLVMLESMAAGTPWVSFDVGCVRENVGGVVVNSPQEMVTTTLKLLGDSDQRHKLGQNGRACVTRKHDWESITTQYEDCYKATAKTRKR